jgi:hypothetical protein
MDLGVRGWLLNKHWYYDITTYSIFVRNMLLTKRISEDIFTGINAGSTRIMGIEFHSTVLLRNKQSESPWPTPKLLYIPYPKSYMKQSLPRTVVLSSPKSRFGVCRSSKYLPDQEAAFLNTTVIRIVLS